MDRLSQHTSLPSGELSITAEALLDAAAAGTSLALHYCRYLLTALLDAVSAASDAAIDRPEVNLYTVFATTWHKGTLSHLSNADIANLWRLADYLLLDAACFGCLEDVLVQRQVRSGINNSLRFPTANLRRVDVVCIRTSEILQHLRNLYWPSDRVARGVDAPVDRYSMSTAASWGHCDWGLLLQSRARGVEWLLAATSGAAIGGHLGLLQQLRHEGCPWDESVIKRGCLMGHSRLVIWAVEHYAPCPQSWLCYAAHGGCLAVLQWAQDRGLLPAEEVPNLKSAAAVSLSSTRGTIIEWLDKLGSGLDSSVSAAAGIKA
jgi:hypothetical protein